MDDLAKTDSGLAGRLREDPQPARLLVFSPHLDDAVFSCGALLVNHPGSVVCTVFCGVPPRPLHTRWDRRSGFADSDAAMYTRYDEDNRALAQCQARPWRLPFFDDQYERRPAARDIAVELGRLMQHFDEHTPLVPLGLHHPDHCLVGDAWEMLMTRGRLDACVAYEDAIYRAMDDTVSARLASLALAGIHARPLPAGWLAPRDGAAAASAKRRAVTAYRSQLRAFGSPMPADLAEPERYWLLEAVPGTATHRRGLARRA